MIESVELTRTETGFALVLRGDLSLSSTDGTVEAAFREGIALALSESVGETFLASLPEPVNVG